MSIPRRRLFSKPFGARARVALRQLILGEKALGCEHALTCPRFNRDIVDFFGALNLDVRLAWDESRWEFIDDFLAGLDWQSFARVCEAVVSPSEFAGAEDISHETAATHLNSVLQSEGAELVFNGQRYECRELGEQRRVSVPIALALILSDAYVLEQLDKCDAKLSARDYDGAITNARTLLEAVLFELQEDLVGGARDDFGGDIAKLFKQVCKAMNLDTEKSIDDRFKDTVRGLVMVVGGLAPLRNKLSDSHARVKAPAPHHARFVVNATKTIVVFLVESYAFQREKGLLNNVNP